MKKILRNFTIFLTLNVCGGCAHGPVATSFDGQWEFIERPGLPIKACLVEDDVTKLRELLIRCKAAQ